MSLRLRVACRPILGLLVRGRAVPVPPQMFYVLRDRRTGAYVADPYRENVDRRRHYCRNTRDAYRFVRRDIAARAGDDLGGSYDVIELPP
jgi:hypothetical protein